MFAEQLYSRPMSPSLTQLLFSVISSHHTLAYHTIAGLTLTYHWLKFFVFASVYCWSCIVLWVWQVHEWSMIPIWHYAEELHGLTFPQVFPLASLFSSPSPQTLRGLLPVSVVLPFPDFRSFYFCLRGGFVLFYFALLLETGSCYLAQAGLWVFPPQLPSELRVHHEAGCGFWFYWTRVPFLAPPLNWEHWSCLAFSICSSSGQLFSPGDRGVSQWSSVHERLQPPKRHPAPRYLREMPERGWKGLPQGVGRVRLGGALLAHWILKKKRKSSGVERFIPKITTLGLSCLLRLRVKMGLCFLDADRIRDSESVQGIRRLSVKIAKGKTPELVPW